MDPKTTAVSNRMQIGREDLDRSEEQSEMINEEILRNCRKNHAETKEAPNNITKTSIKELKVKEDQYECKDCNMKLENKNNLRNHICNTQKKIESITDHEEKTDIAKVEAVIVDGKEHREDIAKMVSGHPELAENMAKLPRGHLELVELNRGTKKKEKEEEIEKEKPGEETSRKLPEYDKAIHKEFETKQKFKRFEKILEERRALITEKIKQVEL